MGGHSFPEHTPRRFHDVPGLIGSLLPRAGSSTLSFDSPYLAGHSSRMVSMSFCETRQVIQWCWRLVPAR